MANRLKTLARKLNLGENVRFTGFLPNDDLPSVLNSIDVFVMPSEAELLSIATLQAMGCARPILAADAVALPELVSDNVNGLLFEPGNVADAVRSIEWFIAHPERWEGMGAASLERVRTHSLENIGLEYEKFYQKILVGKS
jgi:1,2-diacylglycerol 3-alpha-glucosyltransferase